MCGNFLKIYFVLFLSGGDSVAQASLVHLILVFSLPRCLYFVSLAWPM